MKQLDITPSGYDHVFWALAIAVAIPLWVLTEFAPRYAYVGGNAILVLVMTGWIYTVLRAKDRAIEEAKRANTSSQSDPNEAD